MKINIIMDNNYVLTNYVNINPLSSELSEYLATHHKVIQRPVNTLEGIALDAEVKHLRCMNILTSFEYNDVPKVLAEWCKKIRHKGEITIIDVDSIELSKAFINNTVALDYYNMIGSGKSKLTITYVAHLLSELGFKIVNQKFENLRFIITGVRL